MVSALVTASEEIVGALTWVNASFAQAGLLALQGLADCETLSMKKLPTGEPYAGKPPVRFGGRGGVNPSRPLSFFFGGVIEDVRPPLSVLCAQFSSELRGR